ncbi:MAG TPA: NADH-quinone oxidoreductase subunit A [Pseudomonadales bacterium]|nr:NADH-quinone oxidoreductase subunit A [Pseudomonadales bacterium]
MDGTIGGAAGLVGTAAADHQNLWPFLTYSLLVVVVLAGALGLGWLVGGRSDKRAATLEPFESGVVPVGSAEEVRFSIEFYLVAMFFVIFDLETIYIFAWAVAFWDLGWRGYAGASIFITILVAVLVYELRSGALDWGVRKRGSRALSAYANVPRRAAAGGSDTLAGDAA